MGHFSCRGRRLRLRISTASLVFLVASGSARATDYSITSTIDELTVNGICSLREALRAAALDTAVDACPAGSTEDAIYLNENQCEFINGTEFINSPGSISISGGSIDMQGQNQFLYLFDGTRVLLRDLTISNGWGFSSGYGAVSAIDSHLVIENSTFAGNSSSAGQGGGGLSFFGVGDSSLSISRTGFYGNLATFDAGGAYVSAGAGATAELRDLSFIGNESYYGGLVLLSHSGSHAGCFRCFFELNTGTGVSGGAYFQSSSGGSLSVVDARFHFSSSNGGPSSVAGALARASESASIRLDRVSVENTNGSPGNLGADIALVAETSGLIELSNALLANGDGDGLRVRAEDGATIEVSHVTITRYFGGVGATLVGQDGGFARLQNSIVTNNGIDLLLTPGGAEEVQNFLSGDPLFDPSAPPYHLSSSSPAIDACDSPTAPSRLADLDHRPRVFGAGPDCGAYEWGAGLFADGFDTGDTGSWSETGP